MAWIKKNLLFVIGLVVACLLLVASVFNLLHAQEAKNQAREELEGKNKQLADLVGRDPYPNKENIQLAKQEQERVRNFTASARARFGTFEPPAQLDNAGFKSLLESTISSLEQEAQRSGVKLPNEKYSFTFGEQRKQLQLPGNSLGPYARELGDIGDICRILFEAKVHALHGLKRPGVGTNETFGNTDILSKKPGTNALAGASIYPYEVAFQCFSGELGSVLEGFVKASKSYVLKTINVERGDGEVLSGSPVATGIPAPAMGMDPILASRYGMGRYGNRYTPQPQPAPVVSIKPNEPVLDEKPLRVTIGLEVVKLGAAAELPKVAGK